MSTPITIGNAVSDSVFGFMAASPADRRLLSEASSVGKQPVHPISGIQPERSPERDLAAALPPVHADHVATSEGRAMSSLPQDGLVAVVKRDCPTCELTAPVL